MQTETASKPTSEIDKALEAAESEASRWRENVATIETKIASAKKVLAIAEQRRKTHALAASIGEPKAKAEIEKIRRDCDGAQRDLADLDVALPEAQRRLAAAEQQERTARLAANEVAALAVKRRRIAAGARVDRAASELEAAIKAYQEQGQELEVHFLEKLAVRGYDVGVSVSQIESLTGERRIMAALPLVLRRLFPTQIFPAQRVPLAVSEQTFWNLPPEDEAKQSPA